MTTAARLPALRAESTIAPVRAAAGPSARLPLRTVLLYALPIAPVGFMWNIVGLFYLKFATDGLGLAPALVGFIFGGARLWDAVSDPLAGYLSDRTRARLGRRRPWMLWSAIPLGLGYLALWQQPVGLDSSLGAAWSIAATFLFFTALTAFRVPHLCLGAELTSDTHERTRLYSWSSLFEIGGSVVGFVVLVALVSGGDPVPAVPSVAGFAAVIACVFICIASLRLREPADHLGRGAASPLEALRDVARNKPFVTLGVSLLLQTSGLVCVMTTLPYAMEYVFGDPGLLPMVLGAFVLPMMLGMPLWTPLSRRFGKLRVFVVARLLEMAALATFWLATELPWACVLMAAGVAGLTDAAGGVLGRSMQADMIDQDERRTGERKEGTYFAMANLLVKLGLGLAVMVVGAVLGLTGFEAGVAQSPEAVRAIRLLISVGPATFVGVGLLGLFWMPRGPWSARGARGRRPPAR